jgi:hypothetical protein
VFVRAIGLGSWSRTPVIVLTLREARNLPIYLCGSRSIRTKAITTNAVPGAKCATWQGVSIAGENLWHVPGSRLDRRIGPGTPPSHPSETSRGRRERATM